MIFTCVKALKTQIISEVLIVLRVSGEWKGTGIFPAIARQNNQLPMPETVTFDGLKKK
jgi:hypothetical protein